MQIDLPWPPSVNNYWRVARGRIYISAKGTAYRETVAYLTANLRGYKAETRLAMSIVANPPDRRKRDLDNLFKCVLDALEKANIYANDEQIDALSITRGAIIKEGSLLITLNATKQYRFTD